MVKLSYCLVQPNHISEIPYSLSHRRSNRIIAVCPGEKSKQFYTMLNINANYKNITPLTFDEYLSKDIQKDAIVILMCAANTFEILSAVLKKSEKQSHEVILSLIQQNKKYLNIIGKKIENLQLNQMIYSPNKFVGINDKIRELVDKSYDMNRAAFYAYGQYINYYRANLLHTIFRTQLINVDNLARSYGFTSAQRVKQGNFLKPAAQKQKQAEKKAEKRKNKKLNKLKKLIEAQQPQQQQQQSEQVPKNAKKVKKIVKNKSVKVRKTK